IDGGSWIKYASDPDLSGTHTVTVRVAADSATGAPAGLETTLNFTANPAEKEVKDNSTGITVKGDLPAEASKILVQAIDDQSKIADLDKSLSSAASKTEAYNIVAAYDLSLLNDSNEKIHTDGIISISIPLDESIANKNLVVFYVDDNGAATKMASTLADGVITFTATHFGQYVLAEVVPVVTATDNSGTNSTSDNTSSTNTASTAVGTTIDGNTSSPANANEGTAASTISTVSTAGGSTTANTSGSVETITADTSGSVETITADTNGSVETTTADASGSMETTAADNNGSVETTTTTDNNGSVETTATAGTSSGTTAGTGTTSTSTDLNEANIKTGSSGKVILPIVIIAIAGLVLAEVIRRKRHN
ncbi:MAG: hypothetical protein ABRQ25_14795, partial [Clostridiaceae bacterium]